MRTRIIVNPAAGGGRAAERVRSLSRPLEESMGSLEWEESRDAADLVRRVRAAARDGRRVIVAGGDGTAHFAANALVGADVPLGILPVGTGNDIAVSVGVPLDLERAVHVLASQHERAFDLVAVEDRVACCVVGVGMDTEALQRINSARVLSRGHLLYTLSALQTLFTYRARRVRIAWEGGSLDTELEFAAVTNTKSYAGGMKVTPRAIIDDGLLDLCVIERTSLPHMVANFSRVLSGKHAGMKGVVMAQSAFVRIECEERLPVTLDGELTDLLTPLDARVLPGALRLLGAPVDPPPRPSPLRGEGVKVGGTR